MQVIVYSMIPCASPPSAVLRCPATHQPVPPETRLTAISDAMTAEGEALDLGDKATAAKYSEAGWSGEGL